MITNTDNSDIEAGKCALQSGVYDSRGNGKYLRDNIHFFKDGEIGGNGGFSTADQFYFTAIDRGDGKIAIKAVSRGKYLKIDNKVIKTNGEDLDQCGDKCEFYIKDMSGIVEPEALSKFMR